VRTAIALAKDPMIMAWTGLEHIVREQQLLAPYTWFRLGGAADFFAEPTSLGELVKLVNRCREDSVSVRLLGSGSRVLVPDDGVRGLVIHLSAPEFCEIRVEGSNIVAGGGGKLGHVVSTAVREGLSGLESLVGIPGTVAGALRGNAESHGTSIGQWTERATVMTHQGDVVERDRGNLRFSYGESNLDDLVILQAVFELEPGDANELTRRMQKLWIVKRASQPSGELGTGRIFKDPQGLSAAELINQVGLSGQQVGAARLADASANFIEVTPGARSQDVRELIELVRARVASTLGVTLETELEIW
jgi:UDP-N-acetylmuramate dehydrogenase